MLHCLAQVLLLQALAVLWQQELLLQKVARVALQVVEGPSCLLTQALGAGAGEDSFAAAPAVYPALVRKVHVCARCNCPCCSADLAAYWWVAADHERQAQGGGLVAQLLTALG